MLKREFFARDTTEVARDLVGTYLCRERGGEVERWLITETEGYLGEDDSACHARFGKTARSQVMYGEPAIMYVYLIYGMYDMLNIVTRKAGEPEVVLIRGIESADGPGKLTRELAITVSEHNDKPLGRESGVWIEARDSDFDASRIKATPRIGINYVDKHDREARLRFTISDS